MKKHYPKYIISFVILTTILSCSSSKEMLNGEDLNTIKTNGIYVAYNPFAIISSSPDITSQTVPTAKKALYIIRFTSQNGGIIVPHSDTLIDNFSINKISEMYKWTFNYEKENPIDKEFIHFKLNKIGKDSIAIPQTSKDVFIQYKGVNYGDSLILNHAVGITKEQLDHNARNNTKVLNFIFYEYPPK